MGYCGPAPRNRFVNEAPHASATAALYPNIEHVLVHNEDRSPIDDLDRTFFLFDLPVLNLCNSWGHTINDAARARGLAVLLHGTMGNMSISYNGLELLPELFRTWHWLRWWREARALVANQSMRWRGVLARTFGPWCLPSVWLWLNKLANGATPDIAFYTAINLRRFAELDMQVRARDRHLDLTYRPWKDSFSMRLWALQRDDPGNCIKGVLAGWQIDQRDPTADLRLVEFCLSVPTEQFLRNGMQKALACRALADRLPKKVLEEKRKGLQAADWHETLTATRNRVAAELDRFDDCPAAAKALDLPRLHQLVENWPSGGWEKQEVFLRYRYALLRAISTGHFLRRATGSNR
jgi:asparagine synthase (glutamine-hydrolysing)